MTYTLSDNIINNIAQLLQLSMLTGTDITDHFRMIKLSPGLGDKLDLDPEYQAEHEARIQALLEEAQKVMEAQAEADQRNTDDSVGFV